MNSNTPLFFIIVGIVAFAAYLMATAPKITAEERKEMEEDWWE